jgi:hypothetical protein
VLLDWLVINDQKLPNWVWPTLYTDRAAIRLSATLKPIFAYKGLPRGHRDWSLRPYSRISGAATFSSK